MSIRMGCVLAVGLTLAVAQTGRSGDCPTPGCATSLFPGQAGKCNKIYPLSDAKYLKRFCGPTIAPGSCFGYHRTQWKQWEQACGEPLPEQAGPPSYPAPAPAPISADEGNGGTKDDKDTTTDDPKKKDDTTKPEMKTPELKKPEMKKPEPMAMPKADEPKRPMMKKDEPNKLVIPPAPVPVPDSLKETPKLKTDSPLTIPPPSDGLKIPAPKTVEPSAPPSLTIPPLPKDPGK